MIKPFFIKKKISILKNFPLSYLIFSSDKIVKNTNFLTYNPETLFDISFHFIVISFVRFFILRRKQIRLNFSFYEKLPYG